MGGGKERLSFCVKAMRCLQSTSILFLGWSKGKCDWLWCDGLVLIYGDKLDVFDDVDFMILATGIQWMTMSCGQQLCNGQDGQYFWTRMDNISGTCFTTWIS